MFTLTYTTCNNTNSSLFLILILETKKIPPSGNINYLNFMTWLLKTVDCIRTVEAIGIVIIDLKTLTS